MSSFIHSASVWTLAVLALCGPALAQAGPATVPMPDPPRTADGRPDLQGFWTNVSVTSLQRPGNIPRLVLTPDEAKGFEDKSTWNVNEKVQTAEVDTNALPPSGNAADFATKGYNSFWLDPGRRFATVKGEIRSSWITQPIDGRLPPTTAAQKAAGSSRGFGTFDGPETRPLAERCLVSFSRSAGPVMQNSLYNNNYQIVQTPDHVVFLVEMNHDTRIIPLVKGAAEARRRPLAIQPWFGDSVGWYDGDTLVVETVSVNPAQRAQMSPAGKLTERFTRWSDEQILYEFTVEDPTYYTATWKGEMSLSRSKEPLYEYACHEGNYALNGILAGARVQEMGGGKVARNLEEER
ncbi:MAG: hypothetical protein SGJ21_08675 [Alphaproteobacteria bacterium]|nr:hypothetical protein [Alphaproteobacteria bacterium]